MKKKLLYVLPLMLAMQAYGQKNVRQYVQTNVITVNSIAPNATDFSDLKAIGEAIGDARIVMLGEQDHGDGATMQAKTRLIKYLHEEKGFTVLAFENDFFALNQGWTQVSKDESRVSKFLEDNIYSIWAKCGQCADLLYSYIPGTQSTMSPLHVTGFDNQLGGGKFTREHIRGFLDHYLRGKGIAYVSSTHYPHFLSYTSFLGQAYDKIKPRTSEIFIQMADTVLSQLGTAASEDFAYLVLESMREEAKQRATAGSPDFYVNASTIRDRQMARNLDWLAHVKYPSEKIIVWAANAHIMKDADTAIRDKKSASIPWMGTVFTKDSLNASQTYVMAFTSRAGTFRRPHQPEAKVVLKPFKNGFETWMEDSLQYGFVDFKGFREVHPASSEHFSLKSLSHSSFIGNWTDVFDGVFYIRDMQPCE